jgi:DGQHR domain-containing protein
MVEITGQTGRCGDQTVFLGFAQANLLCRASYADILDERTGQGYQRRIARDHSLNFKRYLQQPGATSIPLTFNLRTCYAERWQLVPDNGTNGETTLRLDMTSGPVLTQVDGQHRLGFLQDCPIPFAFMAFIGLSEQQEMDVFRTINGKAKGLSSSLLDFTEAKSLGSDLAQINPALFIALGLNRDPTSPWYGRLDLGGEKTIGTKRVASLRTMHQGVTRLLKEARLASNVPATEVLSHTIAYWQALAIVLPTQWEQPRHHMIVKGIGVYALMSLAGLLIKEAEERPINVDYFVGKLSDFIDQVDWSNHGPLEGFGGAKGADMALKMIQHVRGNVFKRLSFYA